MQQYQFESVNHALTWSLELIRKKRFPQISSFYREIPSSNYSKPQKSWFGEYGSLPSDSEERYLLAQKIYSTLNDLSNEDKVAVLMFYWGDYYCEESLRKSLAFQERMRQEGSRVRLSYRYSQRQISNNFGMSKSKVNRMFNRINGTLELKLHELQLLGIVSSFPESSHADDRGMLL